VAGRKGGKATGFVGQLFRARVSLSVCVCACARACVRAGGGGRWVGGWMGVCKHTSLTLSLSISLFASGPYSQEAFSVSSKCRRRVFNARAHASEFIHDQTPSTWSSSRAGGGFSRPATMNEKKSLVAP
jgi:hypothetical protein